MSWGDIDDHGIPIDPWERKVYLAGFTSDVAEKIMEISLATSTSPSLLLFWLIDKQTKAIMYGLYGPK